MQQPMNQQEPIGGQQMTQQMVLCPVRFVYETQVLVQPGDQIPPNQTFFINPQNPPPWMQNRPAPNPVVYVQQLPNNMVSSVQQHMDQNQLYLQQNFANFQLQQHMLAQNQQEMRPTMQIANIVPNMVQNVQQNNMSNERNISQNVNTGQIQGNAQMIQNQLTVANTRQVPNQVNQTVDVQRQVFMNMRPQMTQQVNISRPVMSLNQLQNMQALTNMQNVQIQQANVGQTFMQNIGQRPIAQNVNTVRPQAVATNIMNVQPIAKVREQSPSEASKNVSNTTGVAVPNVKNFTQNYNCRPIQSKRRYVPNSGPPTPKVQTQHIPVQTVPTIYTPDKTNTHQIVTNIAANTTYLNNPNIIRKRKSESPDEVQNKITMIHNHNQIAKPIYNNNNPQQSIVVTKIVNEIGTNTSPVHKPKIINNTVYQMNSNPQINSNQQMNSNQKINSNQPINSNPQMIVVEKAQKIDENLIKMNEPKTTITISPNETDKLIRNTVFTQARGRVLQDKISEVTPQIIPAESIKNTTEKIAYTEAQTEPRIASEVNPEIVLSKVQPPEIVLNKVQKSPEIVLSKVQPPEIVLNKTQPPAIVLNKVQTPERRSEQIEKMPETIKLLEKKPDNILERISEIVKTEPGAIEKTKIENVDSEIREVNKTKLIEQKNEVKEEVVEVKEKIEVKQDILTHVVDGYVIQESNFAFPIRKPLKEKTLFTNPKAEESETTDALKECMKEEMKQTAGDIPLLPFHYLLLNNEKKEEKIKEEEKSEKMTPFAKLQHATVKSWTIEDLSTYLLKFNWKDTVSVFQDHEIDGESLFLVSKNQLMTIGVAEEHADAICEFVKS